MPSLSLRFFAPSRRSRAASVAALGTVTIVAACLGAVLPADEAANAAGTGQVAVGANPITLVQPSDNLLGRMTPAADADTKGMFAGQVGWPVIPVHVALAPNGHLISYGTPVNTAQQGGVAYDDWDPALGTVQSAHTVTPSMANYDSFCNNLAFLPDGRMFMVGGNGAGGTSNQTMYYDPDTGDESMGPVLNSQRWYSTVLRRPNDQYVVIGGGNYYAYGAYLNPNDNSVVATTPEIGNGTGAWSLLKGASSTDAFGAASNRWWYPRAFNAPDGSVFGISGERLWRMTTTGTGSIALVGTLPTTTGVSGAAVMYAPGKILVAGGGEVANGTTTTATTAAETVDISGTKPVVKRTGSLATARQWLNATVLPTGEVLANGGTIRGTDGGAANSAYTTETWNPATGTWRTGAAATRIRTYHSTSVLMPSGAVFTGGGGVPGPEDNFNSEMYYPSYLFTKNASGAVVWANRPTITTIAGNLTWGRTITLGTNDARTISSVSLINAGSVTHSENTDQRRIPLTFTRSGSTITATLPSSVNTAPAGTYELSIVDSKGVPSPAQLVTLKNGAAGTVSVFEADQSAGKVGPAGTVVPGTATLTTGSSVGIESAGTPGTRVSASAAGAASMQAIDGTSTTAARLATGFVVRAGLSNPAAVSFESASQPGSYLAIANGTLTLKASDGSTDFATAATFVRKQGLQGQNSSFQLASDSTMYLKVQNGGIVAQKFDGSDAFRAAATFRVRAALGPAVGYYSIANGNSGLALAQTTGSTAVGTPVVQETATSALSQTWELRDAGDGQYQIVNPLSGLVLGVKDASTAAGGTALTWNDNGTADHLWTIFPRAGHWLIRNVNSGLVLGVDRMQLTSGAQVLQWDDNGTADHYWDFTAQGGAPAAGTYRIANGNSGLLLGTAGAAGRGDAAVQVSPNGGAVQSWKLVAAGAGQFTIANASSGELLGIKDMSTAAGGTALVWDDNGTEDHLWRVVPQGGRYLLVNVHSDLVLGIDRMQKTAGAQVLQWPDNGTADHLWTLG